MSLSYETKRPRILVADDNEMNRNVVQLFLEKLGLDCEFAMHGKEAVDRTAAGVFDIVLMDCQMPIMDGYQATGEIRKRLMEKAPVIIAMTAGDVGEDRERCMAAGMDDYISKPIVFEEMERRLKKYYREPEYIQREGDRQMADTWYGMDFMEEGLKEFMEKNGFDEKIGRKLYNDYITQLPKTLGNIETALVAGDYSELSKLAHQLKGTSGMLRIGKMAELCLVMEMAAKKNDRAEIVEIIDKIKWLFEI